MSPRGQEVYLRRRLNKWQIFFIALGGIIGIGFFRGSSKSLAIAGPVGALVAVVVVGIIATAVMECICELVVLWPIPNAMVEYVKAFVDEDLGTAVGIMYWYTYCVTFSALIISATGLIGYWGIDYVFQALVYVLVPIGLIIINAFPVQVFGWIELFGGIAKLALVIGTIILMFLVNGGISPDGTKIGARYFTDGVTHNNEVANSSYRAVFESIPLATFAYIGVELLTTTAFEALDPDELRLPAANVGWFSTVLYTIATGSFVTNISWQDQNLPQLFQQALTVITDPVAATAFAQFEPPEPSTHAAPLIALYRTGYRFLPSFLNGCFIYSALSCANTALYVASRQLYGLTRTITVDHHSGIIRRGLAWMSVVNYKTKAPWPAIAISALILCWLPFIRIHAGNDIFLQDVQDALINIGSVSCVLMWCTQCVAYILFFHWREYHAEELEVVKPRWNKLFDRRSGGYFKDFQPFWGYLGAVCTFLIVFFFNTVSLWDSQRISVKALSAFVSPAVVLLIWVVKKLSRSDGKRWKVFVNLSDFRRFEGTIQALEDLIYPGEGSNEFGLDANRGTEQRMRLFPEGKGDTLERLQRPVSPGGEDGFGGNVGMRAEPHFNRTNLRLQRSANGMRQEFAVPPEEEEAERVMQERTVSGNSGQGRKRAYIGEGNVEHTPIRYAQGLRVEPVPTTVPSFDNRDFLSPSSASSRRGLGLGDIHEVAGEGDGSSFVAGSDGSRGR